MKGEKAENYKKKKANLITKTDHLLEMTERISDLTAVIILA